MMKLYICGLLLSYSFVFSTFASQPESDVWIKTSDGKQDIYEVLSSRSGYIKRVLVQSNDDSEERVSKHAPVKGDQKNPVIINFCDERSLKGIEQLLSKLLVSKKNWISGRLQGRQDEELTGLIKNVFTLELWELLGIASQVFFEKVLEPSAFTEYVARPNFPRNFEFSPGLERMMVQQLHKPDALLPVKALLYRDIEGTVVPSSIIPSSFRNYIAVLSEQDGICEIWDVSKEKCRRFSAPRPILWGAFISEGVFVGCTDEELVMYNGLTGEVRNVPVIKYYDQKSSKKINCFALSTDYHNCAAACDNEIALIHLPTGHVRLLKGRGEQKDKVVSLTFSKDGKYLLEVRGGGNLRLWNILEDTFSVPTDKYGGIVKCFTSGSGKFYLQDKNGGVLILSVEDGVIYGKVILESVEAKILCFDEDVSNLVYVPGKPLRILPNLGPPSSNPITRLPNLYPAQVINLESQREVDIPSEESLVEALFHPTYKDTLIALTSKGERDDTEFAVNIWKNAVTEPKHVRRIAVPGDGPCNLGITGDGNTLFFGNDNKKIRLLGYFDKKLDDYLTEKMSLEQALGLHCIVNNLQRIESAPVDARDVQEQSPILQRIFATIDHSLCGKGLSSLPELGYLGFGDPRKAVIYYKDLLDNSSDVNVRAAAALVLGNLHYFGCGVQCNYNKARELYETACSFNIPWISASAFLKLGDCFYATSDFDGAAENYVKASEQDANYKAAARVHCKLGQMYYQGLILADKTACPTCNTRPNSDDKLSRLILCGALDISWDEILQRQMVRCANHGCHYKVPLQGNFTKAWEHYENAENQNYDPWAKAVGSRWLGELLYWVGKDYMPGMICQIEPSWLCNRILIMKDKSLTRKVKNQLALVVTQELPADEFDYVSQVLLELSKEHFTQVAQQDACLSAKVESQLRLATMVLQGDKQEVDLRNVLLTLEKLAHQTDSLSAQADARRWLAQIYHLGMRLVTPDHKKVVNYLNKVARQTHSLRSQADAFALLGDLHVQGWGVPYDLVKANKYFKKVYRQDDSPWAKVVGAYGLGIISNRKGELEKVKGYFEEVLKGEKICPSYVAKTHLMLARMFVEGDILKIGIEAAKSHYRAAKAFYDPEEGSEVTFLFCSADEVASSKTSLNEIEDYLIRLNKFSYDLDIPGFIGTVPSGIVKFLRTIQNPKETEYLHKEIPTGILLYGPPGTGKTYLVERLAKKLNANLIEEPGSNFLNKKKGVARLKELFKKAEDSAAPEKLAESKHDMVIVFMDEIDSVAKSRQGEGRDTVGVVNTFLESMPKMPGKLLFIVNTNHIEKLDSAFCRRFTHVEVPYQKERQRAELLYFFLKKHEWIPDHLYAANYLAGRTENWGSAHLKIIVNKLVDIASEKKITTIDGTTYPFTNEWLNEAYNEAFAEKNVRSKLKSSAGTSVDNGGSKDAPRSSTGKDNSNN